jgi:hypothetical protein
MSFLLVLILSNQNVISTVGKGRSPEGSCSFARQPFGQGPSNCVFWLPYRKARFLIVPQRRTFVVE